MPRVSDIQEGRILHCSSKFTSAQDVQMFLGVHTFGVSNVLLDMTFALLCSKFSIVFRDDEVLLILFKHMDKSWTRLCDSYSERVAAAHHGDLHLGKITRGGRKRVLNSPLSRVACGVTFYCRYWFILPLLNC